MNSAFQSTFSEWKLGPALTCLEARRKTFQTGELLVREGERTRHFGIILSGAVNVVRYSLDGDEKVLTRLIAGQAFGTSFVLGGETRAFGNILATEPTSVLFLRGDRVLSPCARRCPAHVDLVCRLLEMIAQRNTMLARKLDCLTQKTTAEKLLSYLEMQAEAAGSRSFDIPFTRQQLADYLNVDRVALCIQISRLVKEGRIETQRKHFRLRSTAIDAALDSNRQQSTRKKETRALSKPAW